MIGRLTSQALFGLMLLLLTGCAAKVRPVFHVANIQKITYDVRKCKLLDQPTLEADFVCDKVGIKVDKIEYVKKRR